MFLKNIWYIAGWSSEFETEAPAGRMIANEPVVIYRTQDSKLFALEDRCAHRWAPLSKGRVEGDALRCMYHGVRFASDGRGIEAPGQAHVTKAMCVRAYPIVEKHQFAWVWLGDPALADVAQIPDLSMLDQSGRHLNRGFLDYEANYFLINDNLLDLSHIGFLHENTLGQRIESDVRERQVEIPISGGMDAKAIEGGVRFDSWSDLFYRTIVLPKKFPGGDLWTRTDYLMPGIFISNWRIYEEGVAKACEGKAPGPEHRALSDSMSIQAVVPMTARRTRYFFSLGHQESDMDEDEAAAIWRVVQNGFLEDLDMIHAQQKIIDDHPGARFAGIAADCGPVMFRNLMKERMAAERGCTPDEVGISAFP